MTSNIKKTRLFDLMKQFIYYPVFLVMGVLLALLMKFSFSPLDGTIYILQAFVLGVLALFMGFFLYRNSEKLLERPFLFFATLMAVFLTIFLLTTYGAPYTPPSYILLGIVCVVTIFVSLLYTFPLFPFQSYLENSRRRKEVIIIVILVVLAILPTHTFLTKPGFPESHDLTYHVSNVWVMFRYWREGIIYSPFDPWNGIGGLALFRFYHFLGYYFTFPFSWFLNTFQALKGAIVTSFILCALSVYYMTKKISKDSIVASISAISFTFIGLHLTTAFYRGTFTELMGYMYVPLIFVLSRESLKTDSNRRLVKAIFSGIFLAGLILTHLPTAYISVYIITMYLIYSLLDELISHQLTVNRAFLMVAMYFVPIGVGLGLTAWWLIPAYTQTSTILWSNEVALSTGGYPASHFVSLPQLYTRELWWRMRGSKIGIAGEMPFYIGTVSLGLALLAFFIKPKDKNSKNNETKFFMALLVISLILADYPSVFIYYYVPLISFFKWPWRFLLPASISIAYLTGIVVSTFYEKAKAFEIKRNFKFRLSHWILVITVLLILVDMWPYTGAYKWEYFPQDEDYLNALQWIKSSDTGLYRISDLYGRGRGESITKTEFYEVEGPQWWTASRSLENSVSLNPSLTKELGYLSLKYLIVRQKNDAEWLLNGWQKIRFYENSNISILQNPYFRPMVEIVDDADTLFPNSIGTAEFVSINPTALIINAQSSDGGILLVKYGIFPNWKAYLDSTEINIKENKFGIITLELPEGEHLITLRFEENVPIGYPISILCLVGVLFYLSVVLILPKFKLLISNAKNQKK
ncbi:hypothetical protein [Candidatus Borrarchaeum sp.]|uniref:hypothetical protein n=1 Tax=Candidatus Borrarchaeum sp. TaxID=2846742 RepID=UPI00257BB70F|nr:hypothetical protein [Candidatus Borrarchaeum sp.]